jgi:glycosyltransferase involved in cell wall biosynthesis
MQDNDLKFSILISIYCKESPAYFDRAMQSLWHEQTVKPNEIILVEDGRLTDELYQGIKKWKEELGDVLKITPLKNNVGVGGAKNIGIEKCTNELIAVMDTDDISLPNRFEKQLEAFKSKDIDVCGAWIGEFERDEKRIISNRKVPEQQQEIIKFAKSRSPVNHVTAMYKKKTVLNAGNYEEYRASEDYNLWVKMILVGAKFYNIQESLVSVRVSDEQFKVRRGGLSYAINEIRLQYEFLTMGFISPYIFVKNLALRIPVRLLPNKLRYFVYKLIRSQKT